MADNIEDPMANSGDEDQDIERPPTPDYDHEGNNNEDEGFSDISEDEEKGGQDLEQEQSPARPGSITPVSEPPDDVEDEDENQDMEHVESPSALSPIEVEEKEEERGDSDEDVEISETTANDNDHLDKETVDEEEHTEDQREISSPLDTSDNVSEHEDIATDQTTVQNEEAKCEENIFEKHDADEEELGIPLSPIGFGLSAPEVAIVDDILKSEVLPEDHSGDSQGEETEKSKSDEKETEENEDEKEEEIAVDDEDIFDKSDISENVDVQDEETSEPEEAVDQLIDDIFGASDEEEEFEGFGQEDIEITKAKQDTVTKKSYQPIISDDEDEADTGAVAETMVVPKPVDDKGDSSESDDEGGHRGKVWDFDVMMEQKKAIRSKRRKRKGDSELISDSDDLVVEMVKQMKQAAEDDKMLNEAKQAATKKLKLLPLILTHLNKADLVYTFIDSGILNSLKEWLSPLPDGSLPHLQIRTGLLKILSSFPRLDTGALKMSGLGKAVMYVYRHPKEVRQNKDLAGKLINEWARPIFGVTSNFKSMSREEREERDYQNMSKRRRLSSADEGGRTPRSIDRALQGEKKAARPGEKGFIMRARVPTPSNKDYVVRPKSTLEGLDFQRVNKMVSRADKQLRKFKDRNKTKAPTHAATISIEGRKMAL